MIAISPGRSSPIRRRGLTSVAALIALIVVGLISLVLLKVALHRRAEVGIEERRLQAEWLAESGLERAAARLLASKDYAGETWEIPAEDLGGRGAAKVAIAVEAIPDQPDRRKVRVRASYPSGTALEASRSREIVVSVHSNPR